MTPRAETRETSSDDYVECPACGHQRWDDLYDVEDGDTLECNECGAAMAVGVTRWITYRATLKPAEAPDADAR